MINRWFLLAGSAPLVMPVAAAAQQARASVEVTATGGYSNNPFAETGSGTGSAFAALDVTPEIRLQTERSTVTVSGLAHIQEYTGRYPVNDSYRGSLDYRARPSARLTLFGHLDLTGAVIGGDDDYTLGRAGGVAAVTSGTSGNSVATTGVSTSPSAGSSANVVGSDATSGPLISDIGLLGTRDRRRSLYATVGGTEALSAHDAINLNGFTDLARYSQFADRSDYNGYGGTLGYSRQLSSYFSAGFQGSASRYDYRGVLGSTNVYSLQATTSGQLGQYWKISGALGASFINTDMAGASTLTSLSGNVQLCRAGARDTFCALGSRNARATGFNGAQYVTTAGLNWNHRLSERSRLTLDGSYVQEGGVTPIAGLQNQYLRLSATYDRQLRQRLRLLVSARYRSVFGGAGNQASDYGGQLGLSYRFGDPR